MKRPALPPWRLGTEARLEAARTLSTLQRIGYRNNRQDSQPDELWTVLVADVDRLRRNLLEIQPHLGNRVAGSRSHSGGGIILVERVCCLRALAHALCGRCRRRRF